VAGNTGGDTIGGGNTGRAITGGGNTGWGSTGGGTTGGGNISGGNTGGVGTGGGGLSAQELERQNAQLQAELANLKAFLGQHPAATPTRVSRRALRVVDDA